MSNDTPSQKVTAAARALCRRASEAFNVDFEDNWKIYGHEYIKDAEAALVAAGVIAVASHG
ncbi:hypothetical protein [Stenotrophomonas maltophilia]|uniref:hypothetical protein n=1 Tax=Stenotrophomonas maltophilia TaxID=40324 RepID=UPI001451E388|nr:hypothetical protein [Stenotrophomonas maltophilia]QJC75458.1 hypothetical protein HGN30_16395 [Stenotrophomonas maltophilia]